MTCFRIRYLQTFEKSVCLEKLCRKLQAAILFAVNTPSHHTPRDALDLLTVLFHRMERDTKQGGRSL